MRPVPLLSLAMLLAACASAPSTTSPSPPRVVLRGGDCLDPAMARGWQTIARDEVLVDAGRRKYRITVSGSCLFGSDIALRFEGDPVSGRVCGNTGDRVVTRDGTCWVDRLELIDAETWREMQNTPHAEAEATTR